MATPTITINPLVFKGNRLDLSGTVDASDSTVTFFLDPKPAGTPIGPFALPLTGKNFSVTGIVLGTGKWAVRVVAVPTSGTTATKTSDVVSVGRVAGRLVLPAVGSGSVVDTKAKSTKFIDAASDISYHGAVAAAAAGSKRKAAATALINAMGAKQRLIITRDDVVIINVEYTGALTSVVKGSDVVVSMSTPTSVTIVGPGDITTGKWAFDLQGGTNFAIGLRGTVGAVGSNADITLASSPAIGVGFGVNFTFTVPRAFDNLT
jgi:hypothetical protein